MRKSQAADVGHDLFVSDYHHCNARGSDYDRVIHIWRESQGAHGCRQVLSGKPTGLAINWTEPQSFSKMSATVIPQLANFLRPSGKVLIHCQAGHGRAPCLALLAKILRGCDPYTALADIVRANRLQRGLSMGMWGQAIDEAVDFWEHWIRGGASTASAPTPPKPWQTTDVARAADTRRLAATGRTAPARRVRVGIVSLCLQHGGAEQWIMSLLRHCDPAAIEWTGVAVRYPEYAYGEMHEIVEREITVGVGPESVDALYAASDVALVWGIESSAQRIPPRPRTCKVVLVSHGVCDFTSNVFKQPGPSDAAVAVSAAAVGPIPLDWQPSVIPNCYDPERLTADPSARDSLRAQWGVRPGERVVGFLGRCSREKNPEALVHLVASSPATRGVFVGIGDTEPLGQLAGELGATDRVVFHGPVLHPGYVLSAFDHLLLPSHQDASAITVLEAWAAAVPVIATPVGVAAEHPDLVRRVPLRPTGEQLAEALARDLADIAAVANRVERAQALARDRFGPQRFGEAWTRYLLEVAAC